MELTLNEKYELIKKHLIEEKGTNPIKIVKSLMHSDFINIHGPEHHFLDGAAFMKALNNTGLDFNFEESLDILAERTIKMPGAMCGYWGMCGSTASIGAVFAIIDNTGPLSNDIHYKEHMEFTSNVINKMSKIGGPRCCKRNAFLSIISGVEYANEHYNINLELDDKIECEFSSWNKLCIGDRLKNNRFNTILY